MLDSTDFRRIERRAESEIDDLADPTSAGERMLHTLNVLSMCRDML